MDTDANGGSLCLWVPLLSSLEAGECWSHSPAIKPFRNVLILVNPVGGKGKAKNMVQDTVIPILEAAGTTVTVKGNLPGSYRWNAELKLYVQKLLTGYMPKRSRDLWIWYTSKQAKFYESSTVCPRLTSNNEVWLPLLPETVLFMKWSTALHPAQTPARRCRRLSLPSQQVNSGIPNTENNALTSLTRFS